MLQYRSSNQPRVSMNPNITFSGLIIFCEMGENICYILNQLLFNTFDDDMDAKNNFSRD